MESKVLRCKCITNYVRKNSCAKCAIWGRDIGHRHERKNKILNVMEMKCLRSMCSVARMDRISNEEIRKRVGCKLSCQVE